MGEAATPLVLNYWSINRKISHRSWITLHKNRTCKNYSSRKRVIVKSRKVEFWLLYRPYIPSPFSSHNPIGKQWKPFLLSIFSQISCSFLLLVSPRSVPTKPFKHHTKKPAHCSSEHLAVSQLIPDSAIPP